MIFTPRHAFPERAARLRFDRYDLDEADARLTCAGKPVPLAPTPFDVLCTLARSPGRLVTKNALLEAVWGHRFVWQRRLLVCWEYYSVNFLGFVHLAALCILLKQF